MQRDNILYLLDHQSSHRALVPSVQSHDRGGAINYLDGYASLILSRARSDLAARTESGMDEDATEDELGKIIEIAAAALGFEISAIERDYMVAQLIRESHLFGILQPLFDNHEVSDIIVHDYCKIVVQCGRSTFRTDMRFADQKSYEAFVEKLLLRAGTSYSTKKPIADGMIGSFARIHAVHRCLCETGPYITIRINRMARVTIDDLTRCGVAPPEIFEYLKRLVIAGCSIFIAGEVGTGKTTLVRALAAVIPHDESILVIEDTPEIQLEHPYVRAITTRETNTEGAGRVSPSECIRAGMRMAMNRIIFGEIRDAEAAEALIDVCASGHPGVSTIHARSASESLTRLELFLGRAQRGVAHEVVSQQITTAIQVIIFVGMCRLSRKRRIFEIKEIGPAADGVIRQRDIFRYTAEAGNFFWKVVTRASAHREFLERCTDPFHLSELPAQLGNCSN